jgi:hypothetical protein
MMGLLCEAASEMRNNGWLSEAAKPTSPEPPSPHLGAEEANVVSFDLYKHCILTPA